MGMVGARNSLRRPLVTRFDLLASAVEEEEADEEVETAEGETEGEVEEEVEARVEEEVG